MRVTNTSFSEKNYFIQKMNYFNAKWESEIRRVNASLRNEALFEKL
jgi:hypothetical protein